MKAVGPWEVECDLRDGARISALRFDGFDLLTRPPAQFRPPVKDYGRYETRPVFGYDDCFPTVDPCDGWPDHGELCWLPWSGTEIECEVRSARLPLVFRRLLEFSPRALTWRFEARNEGDRAARFQHVMHPLMPLDQISQIDLPDPVVARRLLAEPGGSATMLFLPASGSFALGFRRGPRLSVRFDPILFPTLGIWWNHGGYPDEDGLRRCECAFEPIPGKNSTLSDGTTMAVEPGASLCWRIEWQVQPGD